MRTEIINDAAMVLDDIASGTLSQGDFYAAMDTCGIFAVNLCKMVISGEISEHSVEGAIVVKAADCMKDICISEDNDKTEKALGMAKVYSNHLYRVADQFA